MGRTSASSVVVARRLFRAARRRSKRLLAASLPTARPLHGPMDLAIVARGHPLLRAVTLFQSVMARQRLALLAGGLRPSSQGLYVNTLANRADAPASGRAAPPPSVSSDLRKTDS